MDCPGVELTDAGPPSDEDRDGLIACLKGWQAKGVDLNWYNAATIADDVRDLAKVLGLDEDRPERRVLWPADRGGGDHPSARRSSARR